jgi:general secretion pathway protein C
MSQFDPIENADLSVALALIRYEAPPVAQQLLLLTYLPREEPNTGVMHFEAQPTANACADAGLETTAEPTTAADCERQEVGIADVGASVPLAQAVEPANAAQAFEHLPVSALRKIVARFSQARAATLPRLDALNASSFTTHGPRITSLIFGALIAIELARMLAAVTLSGPNQLALPLSVRPLANPHESVDVSRISAAHLFGVAMAGADQPDPANAVPTTTELKLLGTIATTDPARGVAIISNGGPANVFRVGQDLGPGKLRSVYLNRIIIDRDGTLESVRLPRAQLDGATAPPVSAATRSTAADPQPARQLPQGEFGVFQDFMRTEAVNGGPTGGLHGIRVSPGSDSEAFQNAGLQSGDVIIAINGTHLDNPQRRQTILDQIRNAPGATLLIERGGHAQRLGLDFARFGKVTVRESPAATGGAETQD